ncbi:hypothetical protein [Nakamurella sp. PAMC28650]|uniref:hypothetical protein n=1 Tax=Nakamurella sp. PAMC28650 TaxID=2762325 RepID=UPI00164E8B4C|nr:hypothetical protein [Nakamurella sp. PAMC28650]QNK83174.1 hypothetical protein H7F38_11295 [Nakamurella sp. PAMC28650]
MTAGTSIERPVDTGTASDGAAAAAPDASGTVDPSVRPQVAASPRGIPWLRVGAVLGVLVPLAIMVRFAWHSAPSFDGAMNLQVASNLSDGLGFVRNYGGVTLFPGEIQTSGAFLFLAAALIKVLGTSSIVFELPNLIFLALLLVTVSLTLRRWPVMRIIGPSAVLFCVGGRPTATQALPGMVENGLHGYGEYVVAALVLAGFALVGAAASGMRRPVVASGVAWVLVGLAFTVKIIAALAFPVLAVGVIGLALARPAIRRWKLAASVLLAAVPVALVELQRLVSLGSVRAFTNYWSNQLASAGAQAGVSSGGVADAAAQTGVGQGLVTADPKISILRKIGDHLHLLGAATGIDTAILLMVLALPFAVLVGLFLARRESWRTWLARPAALLSVMLAIYAGGYLVWWLAITPTSKAWLRRVIIALVVIALLYLLLIGMAKDHWNARASRPVVVRSTRRNTILGIAWGVAGVLGFLSILPGITTANLQLSVALGSQTLPTVGDAQVEQVATAAESLQKQGDTLYGNGWWSAPVVALYGDLALGNLELVKPCSADIVAGKAYLIWDYFAAHLSSAAPISTIYDYTRVDVGASHDGSFWKVSLKAGITCPAA